MAELAPPRPHFPPRKVGSGGSSSCPRSTQDLARIHDPRITNSTRIQGRLLTPTFQKVGLNIADSWSPNFAKLEDLRIGEFANSHNSWKFTTFTNSRIREFTNSRKFHNFREFANSRFHELHEFSEFVNSRKRESHIFSKSLLKKWAASQFALELFQKSSELRSIRSHSRTSAASFANWRSQISDLGPHVSREVAFWRFLMRRCAPASFASCCNRFTMSAIVDSINLPQQKFFVAQEKLATPNFRKVFCNKKTFLLRRNFFCERSNFFVKSFCATKSFLFEENFFVHCRI